MKTKTSYKKSERMILFILFWILCINFTESQTYWWPIPKIGYPQNPSIITQYDQTIYHYLGIGPDFNCLSWPCTTGYTPNAYLHIREPLSPNNNFSLFEIEETTNGNLISFLSHNATTSYGIFQSGTGLNNYFEGSIGTRSNFSFDASEPRVSIANHINGLQFQFTSTITPGLPVTTLRVKDNGIKVDDLMECNKFKLNDNPADRYVLVSDQDGNGTWTNPSTLNDNDWLVGSSQSGGGGPVYEWLYNNPFYPSIGIGTDHPYSKLHVMDGNILISRSTSDNSNSSIFFAKDACPEDCTNDEWGIEYNTQFTQYNSNGLNFFKPAINGHNGYDYLLYLNNDGTVGIGTHITNGYKLAVKGTIICEELKVKLYAHWGDIPDYVLKKDYKLPALSEVADYINKNQHLPGIPSAKEISEKGLSVGEMNLALLKKVEELTKYLIEQQKQIDELKLKVGNQ